MIARCPPVVLVVIGFLSFIGIEFYRFQQSATFPSAVEAGRVVVNAPILVVLYGGDRFFAANLETMRLTATGLDEGGVNSDYLVRAQRVASDLNPCQEDNYYLANGLLSWGGLAAEGNEILQRAMTCRFWDGMPGFFYGVNLSFFNRDIDGAAAALELSAERWPENSAALRKFAIMLRVDGFSSERLALSYLTRQRDEAGDSELRRMLDKRVVRMRGLVDLRDAQARYEKANGALRDISDLVVAGELSAVPEDPLRLGYELHNGRIELRRMKIVGLEEQP